MYFIHYSYYENISSDSRPINSTAPGPRPRILKFLDPQLICSINNACKLAQRIWDKLSCSSKGLCYNVICLVVSYKDFMEDIKLPNHSEILLFEHRHRYILFAQPEFLDCVFFTQDPSIKFFWANIIRLWILLILKADTPPKKYQPCVLFIFSTYIIF